MSLLKQARKDAKLTQTDVAKAIGEPQSFVSKVESGERKIDVLELWRLSLLYKKPIQHFFPFTKKEFSQKEKTVLKAATLDKNSK
nr:helix-turn-helix transcriptional regulator [Leptospira idonii]